MRILKRIAIGWAILMGANVIASLVVRKSISTYGTEADDEISIVASMSGTVFTSTAQALRSISIVAYMGGVELDLTQASIVDGALISVRAVMGGVDIVVPEGWRVETTRSVFLGGVDNKTNPDFEPESAPLLVVDVTAVMGGVDIHLAGAS